MLQKFQKFKKALIIINIKLKSLSFHKLKLTLLLFILL